MEIDVIGKKKKEVCIGNERANKERLEKIKDGMRANEEDYGVNDHWCVFCGCIIGYGGEGEPAICVDCEHALVQGYLDEVLLRREEEGGGEE